MGFGFPCAVVAASEECDVDGREGCVAPDAAVGAEDEEIGGWRRGLLFGGGVVSRCIGERDWECECECGCWWVCGYSCVVAMGCWTKR